MVRNICIPILMNLEKQSGYIMTLSSISRFVIYISSLLSTNANKLVDHEIYLGPERSALKTTTTKLFLINATRTTPIQTLHICSTHHASTIRGNIGHSDSSRIERSPRSSTLSYRFPRQTNIPQNSWLQRAIRFCTTNH